MSMTPDEAAYEEWMDQLRNDFFEEFTEEFEEKYSDELLISYYLEDPNIMRPAVDAIQEGNSLLEKKHFSASLIFHMSAVELLLKSTLLEPIMFGLITSRTVATMLIVKTMKRSGFDQYILLVNEILKTLAELDLNLICREGQQIPWREECKILQKKRNAIVHRGEKCTKKEAENAKAVCTATYELIVKQMLYSIGLTVIDNGKIVQRGKI